MNGTRHREVGEYLRRLQRSMGDLPAQRRDEILAEIEEHISEDLAERPAATDADVRNVLERVGDPGDIAAEARERFGIKPARRSWTDPAAVILLLIGGFTIIGWFVGVVLLWISDAWNTRDKIIGTLVVPGGLAGALGVGLASSVILAVLVVIAPIATAVYLSLRLRQARLASLIEGEEQ